MDDARMMRGVERIGDVDGVAKHLIEGERTLLQPIGERLPFEVLHHEEICTVVMSDIMQNADVGMSQRANRTRFAIESRPELGILRKMCRKHFDRDRAVEARIARVAAPADDASSGVLQAAQTRARQADGGQQTKHRCRQNRDAGSFLLENFPSTGRRKCVGCPS